MAVANGGPGINPLALDLLEKMLVINPKKRITVTEALAHPYLASLHMAEDEPVHEGGPFDFSWEVRGGYAFVHAIFACAPF